MLWLHRLSGLDSFVSFGELRLAFQALANSRHVCVLELFHWHSVLSGWSNISLQQDVVEFLMFVLSKGRPVAYLISWAAKRIDIENGESIVSVPDSGFGYAPLILEITDGGLQSCFDQWHVQSSLYALRRDTDLLLVQFRRYTQVRGSILKSGISVWIQPGETVWVPCWDNGLELRYIAYTVCALIFHIGATLSSGHYRTALSCADGTGSLRWFLTDDSTAPSRASMNELQMVSQNVYVVGLRRIDPVL